MATKKDRRSRARWAPLTTWPALREATVFEARVEAEVKTREARRSLGYDENELRLTEDDFWSMRSGLLTQVDFDALEILRRLRGPLEDLAALARREDAHVGVISGPIVALAVSAPVQKLLEHRLDPPGIARHTTSREAIAARFWLFGDPGGTYWWEGRPRPAARDLALMSLILGNFPGFKSQKSPAELTPAKVIAVEVEAMRQAMESVREKNRPSQNEPAPREAIARVRARAVERADAAERAERRHRRAPKATK